MCWTIVVALSCLVAFTWVQAYVLYDVVSLLSSVLGMIRAGNSFIAQKVFQPLDALRYRELTGQYYIQLQGVTMPTPAQLWPEHLRSIWRQSLYILSVGWVCMHAVHLEEVRLVSLQPGPIDQS